MYVSAYGAIKLSIPDKVKEKHKIKKQFKYFIKNKELINLSKDKIFIEDIEPKKWGFRATLDIKGICSYKEIEKHEDYLKQLFRAKEVQLTNNEGKAVLEIINKDIGDLEYKKMNLNQFQLLMGHDNKGDPIIIDMKKTPHIGIQGASNSGKSIAAEMALRSLQDKANIVLLNCFKDDFTSIKARRLNDPVEIKAFLKYLLDRKIVCKKPLYLVLDELNETSKDKEFNNLIKDILGQARHYNIFLIAIGQSLLKENCPYKQLFNVRITFRVVDKSSISAFLGCSLDDTQLNQREFICYSDKIYRGKTYTLER